MECETGHADSCAHVDQRWAADPLLRQAIQLTAKNYPVMKIIDMRDIQPMSSLVPIRHEVQPVFNVLNRDWHGHNWGTDYQELVLRENGNTIRIRGASKGFVTSIQKKLKGSIKVERHLAANSLEEAAIIGTSYEWDKTSSAGQEWYLVDDLPDFKRWKAAYDKFDSGEIFWRGDHFYVERRISRADIYFEMRSSSLCLNATNGRIRTFEQAASTCSNMLVQLLLCKGI